MLPSGTDGSEQQRSNSVIAPRPQACKKAGRVTPKGETQMDLGAERLNPTDKIWVILGGNNSPLVGGTDLTSKLLAWSSKDQAEQFRRVDRNARRGRLIPWTLSQLSIWCREHKIDSILIDITSRRPRTTVEIKASSLGEAMSKKSGESWTEARRTFGQDDQVIIAGQHHEIHATDGDMALTVDGWVFDGQGAARPLADGETFTDSAGVRYSLEYVVMWGFARTGSECSEVSRHARREEAEKAAREAEERFDNPACGCWVVEEVAAAS